jgi:hypothetical protein
VNEVANGGNGRRATLRVTAGLSNVTIGTSAEMSGLVRGRFQGESPSINVDGSVVTLRSQRNALDMLLALLGRRPRPRGEITLDASPAWELDIQGGVSHVSADLREIELVSLDIAGGCRSIEIDLPRPTGPVQLQMAGGVLGVTFHRPEGVPVSIHARGGVSGLRVDGQSLPRVGGALRWESPGFSPDVAYYALDVSGGVRGVTVDAY